MSSPCIFKKSTLKKAKRTRKPLNQDETMKSIDKPLYPPSSFVHSHQIRKWLWLGLFSAYFVLQALIGCTGSDGSACKEDKDCSPGQVCTSGSCLAKTKETSNEPVQGPELSEQTSEPDSTQEEKAPEPVQDLTESTVDTPHVGESPVGEPVQEAPDGSESRVPEPTRETLPEPQVEKSPEKIPEKTGKPCKWTSDCGQWEFCFKGFCQKPTNCTADSDCKVPPLNKCIGGICLSDQPPCKVTGSCAPGSICKMGQCVPGNPPGTCKEHADCPANYNCTKGSCKIVLGVGPTTCTNSSTCRSWQTCFMGYCTRKCKTKLDCPSITVPVCQLGVCLRPNLPKGRCNTDSECLPRQYCTPGGACVTCRAKPTCSQNSQCKSGETCVNGQCGVTCKNDAQCRGGLKICSQGFCRGDGYHPVGCAENQEICDLKISKVACPNGKLEVTVQNVGQGPAYGRFYLCMESQGSKKGCNAAIIMNYTGTGSIPVRGIEVIRPGWKIKKGDLLMVDRPNIILEASETNNTHVVQQSCP